MGGGHRSARVGGGLKAFVREMCLGRGERRIGRRGSISTARRSYLRGSLQAEHALGGHHEEGVGLLPRGPRLGRLRPQVRERAHIVLAGNGESHFVLHDLTVASPSEIQVDQGADEREKSRAEARRRPTNTPKGAHPSLTPHDMVRPTIVSSHARASVAPISRPIPLPDPRSKPAVPDLSVQTFTGSDAGSHQAEAPGRARRPGGRHAPEPR
jgi:hypothetical protein